MPFNTYQPHHIDAHYCDQKHQFKHQINPRVTMLGVAQLINDGWSYESRNDHENALRIYKAAFNNLLDINGQVVPSLNTSSKTSNTNATQLNIIPGISPFEIRSVADYLNHRTCYLQFILNHAREAITQFKKYVDTFKQHTKAPEYSFEHAAWLSQQYLMFADLFHQAVQNGVKASKAQHPGYYYYEAAMQMIDRRKNITIYTNDIERSKQMPVTNELLTMITTSNFTSFLRQCGWVCIDPTDAPPLPPPAQLAEQQKSKQPEEINYSEIIIRSLYKAIEYFQEWNKPRMQNHINVMIGDEYMLMKDPQTAQSLYTRSLSMYEKENWSMLVDSIKEKLAIIETEPGVATKSTL